MSETETKKKVVDGLLDFDEEKLWGGEPAPNVAEDLASK
jgi:hypothetical protein